MPRGEIAGPYDYNMKLMANSWAGRSFGQREGLWEKKSEAGDSPTDTEGQGRVQQSREMQT